MSLSVESAPPCVSEAEGPSTCRASAEPQSSLSAKAPAFQPGRTWQKPVAAPDVQAAGWSRSKDHRHQAPVEEGPSTSSVFIAAALQANRGVLQPLPEQRAQCPVSAVPCQRSSPEPRQPVSERPPQPAARHKQPPPTQRPVEPAPDLH